MSLDLRQNSTITTLALAEIWTAQHSDGDEMPEKDSAEWRQWLLDALKEPLEELPNFTNLSESSVATMDLLRLIDTIQNTIDRDAFGVFILSMTRSSEDILGVYLLCLLYTSPSPRD